MLLDNGATLKGEPGVILQCLKTCKDDPLFTSSEAVLTLIAFLLENGASPNEPPDILLHALHNNSLGVVRLLLKHGSKLQLDPMKQMEFGISQNKIKLLLEFGISDQTL